MVTTHLVNTDEESVLIRNCSLPEPRVRMIYKTLGNNEKPFIKEKSVVPQIIPEKISMQRYNKLVLVSCNVGYISRKHRGVCEASGGPDR